MPKIETNTRKVNAQLEKEGWTNIGGGSHDRFVHIAQPGVMITVPRHRELSPGVARSNRQGGRLDLGGFNGSLCRNSGWRWRRLGRAYS
jgi:predicted RNA binding protein YcfA (HicA-like mRNA interferase family)